MTCVACHSHDTEPARDEHGRIVYGIFADSSKELGYTRISDHERLGAMGLMFKCNEQGCRRKFHVMRPDTLINSPKDFRQQCLPIEFKGIPEGSRDREMVSRRFVGLLKRAARSSTENTESYLKSCSDVEGERYEERCILFNKALGQVKREIERAVASGASGFELSRRGTGAVPLELSQLQSKAAAMPRLSASKEQQVALFGTSLCSTSTLTKRYDRILLDEATEKRRELQAVKVGSHFSLDDCPALAKSFSIPQSGKLTLMALSTSNSHELATAILLPYDKSRTTSEGVALENFGGKILTSDDQPVNRGKFHEIFRPKGLLGQARGTRLAADST